MLLGFTVGTEPDEEHPIAKTVVPMIKTHFAKNKFIFPRTNPEDLNFDYKAVDYWSY